VTTSGCSAERLSPHPAAVHVEVNYRSSLRRLDGEVHGNSAFADAAIKIA
jgi:hypothetical protein